MGGTLFGCQYKGCTFRARELKGKHNHEKVCIFGRSEFSRRYSSHDSNNVRIPGPRWKRKSAVPYVQSCEDPPFKPCDDYIENEERNKVKSFQVHGNSVLKKLDKKDEFLEDTDWLALILSEIAHKAGKVIVSKPFSHLKVVDMEQFREKYKNIDDCHTFVDRFVQDDMNINGFKKIELKEETSGFSCSIFCKSPLDVIVS